MTDNYFRDVPGKIMKGLESYVTEKNIKDFGTLLGREHRINAEARIRTVLEREMAAHSGNGSYKPVNQPPAE